MADKSMVEYNDYAMESTGLTGMVSSGFPEIAGERNENSIRRDADGGLPQIGQAAVFAQKWRYHAYF